MGFGADIRARREALRYENRRLSRRVLGDLTGLKATQVEAIEKEAREPKLFESEALVRVLTELEGGSAPQSIADPATASPLDPEPVVNRSLDEEELDPAEEPYEVLASFRMEKFKLTSTRVGPSRDPQKQRYLFSNSEVQAFKRCKRKWWLAWYRRLELKRPDYTGARAIGGRVHRALEAWYQPDGQPRENPVEALTGVIAEDWAKLVEGFNGEVPPDVAKQFTSDTALEKAMVEGYVEWLAETGADQGLRVVAPETYLEATLLTSQQREVKIIGKIDAREVRESDGAILFKDHKTVGDLTTPAKTLHLDEQMLHYHLLEFLNAVNGEHVAGAIYNMLRKVKRTVNANPPFYGRIEVHHSSTELHSFQLQLSAVIDDIVDAMEDLDRDIDHRLVAYPSRQKNCSWDCDFFQVCPMFDDGSRAEDMLADLYSETNPLEHYETEEKS